MDSTFWVDFEGWTIQHLGTPDAKVYKHGCWNHVYGSIYESGTIIVDKVRDMLILVPNSFPTRNSSDEIKGIRTWMQSSPEWNGSRNLLRLYSTPDHGLVASLKRVSRDDIPMTEYEIRKLMAVYNLVWTCECWETKHVIVEKTVTRPDTTHEYYIVSQLSHQPQDVSISMTNSPSVFLE